MVGWFTCCFVVLVAGFGSSDDLTFAEPTARAGIVYTGVPLAHRFSFRNSSSQVLKITNLHTHCGCTTPKLPKLIYQPGERGVLDLEVQTLSQPAGPHRFSVHIEYEINGVEKEAEAILEATLVSEISIDPAKLVVPADHVNQHPFTLHETLVVPLHIVEARSSLPHVKVRMSDPKRDQAGEWTRTFHLEVEPGLPAGKHEARLDLYTDDPKYGHLQTPFVLVKQAAEQVTFSPKEIEINAPAGRSLPSRLIVLRNASPKEMKIGSIEADSPAITTRWAANAEGVIAIRVQVDQARLTGASLESAIHIHLEQPTKEILTVPVHLKLND